MKTPKRVFAMTNTSMGDRLRVADTSFLYALFSKSDEFHARAIEQVRLPDPLVIPAEILSETLALIHYRQGFSAGRASGEWLRSQGLIRIGIPTRKLLARAWRVYVSGRGRLSYPDSVVLAWCSEHDATPLAFDSAILRHARR